MAVGIRTVAEKAKVSIGTVSNVLSGNRPVSEDVRNRVLQAIDDLGYRTNMIGHSLVTKRTKTIGVVLPGFQLDIDGVLIGIDSVLRKKGYSLLVSQLNPGETPMKHLLTLFSRRVDGVIWGIPETIRDLGWNKVAGLDPTIPIVLNFYSPKPGFSSVQMDNFFGGYIATKHLLDHGCRKIAHISGLLSGSIESRDRKAGWEKALREAGLEPIIMCEGDWQVESGRRCMASLLNQYPDIDAVFASNDWTAYGVMDAVRAAGKSIPEDVKLIGFDDNIFLDYANPPLTSVHQDYVSMGICATNELFSWIENPDRQPQAQTIPTWLAIRQSCGCTPDKKSG